MRILIKRGCGLHASLEDEQVARDRDRSKKSRGRKWLTKTMTSAELLRPRQKPRTQAYLIPTLSDTVLSASDACEYFIPIKVLGGP